MVGIKRVSSTKASSKMLRSKTVSSKKVSGSGKRTSSITVIRTKMSSTTVEQNGK